MNAAFTFTSGPELHFGAGKMKLLPGLIQRYGHNVLLVTGGQSFKNAPAYAVLEELFGIAKIQYHHFIISQEPSPSIVDSCVSQYKNIQIDVVLAIGGGSVLDAAKAISAMLPLGTPSKDYLEGVGTQLHSGVKIPLIAVPTTSGTGSEATKNAVLSEVGAKGFKKSLRHSNFVPNIAVLDPELIVSCPPLITAYSGMDAFTQLLESYLATTANAVTDALALKGLELVSESLVQAYQTGNDVEARGKMALAAMLSGATLANAGLGLVHGIAGALGGYHVIPHGVICSRLMLPANQITVKKLRQESSQHLALTKYAAVGKLFLKVDQKTEAYYIDGLLGLISGWIEKLNIPKLSSYGLTSQDLPKIVAASDYKNNPIPIHKEEMIEVLESSL